MTYPSHPLARPDVGGHADLVMTCLDFPLTTNGLCDAAAELERRIHIFTGGPVLAVRIVEELRRRAITVRTASDA